MSSGGQDTGHDTAQSEYNTHYMPTPDPCSDTSLASDWLASELESLSLAGDINPFNTSQQEMSQAAYNNSIADLTNNTLKIMF